MKKLTTVIIVTIIATPCRAQPVGLPSMCTAEHAQIVGTRAPCSGILSPPTTALDGARCVDVLLPTCEALRARDGAVARAEALSLAGRVSESDARAARWRDVARTPCPAPVVRTVYTPRGLPSWAVGAIVAGAAILSAWAGWQARGLVR